MVDLSPGAAAADQNCPSLWVNPGILHEGEINYQAIITNAKAPGIVPAAAHGHE
jgi:hypothetical protein